MTSAASDSQSTQECPIDHTAPTPDGPQRHAGSTKCPVDHASTDRPAAEEPLTCPADHGKALQNFLPKGSQDPELNPLNNMPMAPEQSAAGDQSASLSKTRTLSSIPRAERYQSAGASECPAVHEEPGKDPKKDMWIYPSEQMFFNAMRRKNWNPEERDMKHVVPIHNAVNERCWRLILDWESMHKTECDGPKLLRFEGKANDLSPRARIRSLLGYKRPFDRHDWTVDRCGKSVRYVIDFYSGKEEGSAKSPYPSFYLDVRPALTLEGAWDRTRKYFGF